MLAYGIHAGQQRLDGQRFITHPFHVASLIAHWGFDEDTVLASLLHDSAEDGDAPPEQTLFVIEDMFGTDVAQMVAAVTKNHSIPNKQDRTEEAQQRVQQALITLPTVGAIKLADRCHNSVTSAHLDAARQQTLELENRGFYAAIARRVGAIALAQQFSKGLQSWWCIPEAGFTQSILKIQPCWAN
jgi:GTP pyrophosphokinase